MSSIGDSSASKRPFGLSFPSKPKSKTTTATTTTTMPINKSCLAAAAFSLDDDDDDNNPQTKPLSTKTFSSSKFNPKAKREIEEALEQDPNIYEYDEVYEQVSSTVQQEQQREEKKRLERETNTVRQPKYVAGLLEKSKQREKQYERVQERRIQRERELEGDLFADKEVFVTPAYKAKLAERQADLQREKLEDQREALLNVLQQDNLDAFYRFQFKVRTGDIKILEESEKVKDEPSESIKKDLSTNRNVRQIRSRATNEDDEEEQIETNSSTNNDNMYVRAREKHARAVERERRQDHDEEQQHVDETTSKTVQSNSTVKSRRINDETTQVFDDEQIEMGVGLSGKKHKNEKQIDTKENEFDSPMPIASEKKRHAQETRIERIRRLCEKRTVGDLLNNAQEAYFQRQKQREIFKDYIEKTD